MLKNSSSLSSLNSTNVIGCNSCTTTFVASDAEESTDDTLAQGSNEGACASASDATHNLTLLSLTAKQPLDGNLSQKLSDTKIKQDIVKVSSQRLYLSPAVCQSLMPDMQSRLSKLLAMNADKLDYDAMVNLLDNNREFLMLNFPDLDRVYALKFVRFAEVKPGDKQRKLIAAIKIGIAQAMANIGVVSSIPHVLDIVDRASRDHGFSLLNKGKKDHIAVLKSLQANLPKVMHEINAIENLNLRSHIFAYLFLAISILFDIYAVRKSEIKFHNVLGQPVLNVMLDAYGYHETKKLSDALNTKDFLPMATNVMFCQKIQSAYDKLKAEKEAELEYLNGQVYDYYKESN